MAELPPDAEWEKRAQPLVARVPTPAPLSAEAVERIYRDVTGPAAVARARRRRLGVRGGGVLLLSAAVAGALWAYRLTHPRVVVEPSTPPPSTVAVLEVPPVQAPIGPSTPSVALAPSPSLAMPLPPRVEPKREPAVHAPHRMAPSAPASAPTPTPSPPVQAAAPPTPVLAPSSARSSLDAESAALAQAVKSLRTDHHAKAALGVLDGYDRDFPHGELRAEAQLLRAETLAALHRKAEALSLLHLLRSDPAQPAAEIDRRIEQLEAEDEVQGIPGSGDE